MAAKKARTKKTRSKKTPAKAHVRATPAAEEPSATTTVPAELQDFLRQSATPKGFVNPKPLSADDLRRRLIDLGLRPTVAHDRLVDSVNRVKPDAGVPEEKRPEEIRSSVRALKPELRRFHGAKLALSWFPFPALISSCADRFGYMSPAAVRAATKLPFNVASQALLGQLGGMMGDPGRDPNPASHNPAVAGVSTIPAGFTYFGQFVDHDVTFDISSSLNVDTDANTINNMRSPALDLDSLYSRGPGLDPFIYAFPSAGPPTAVKFQLGTNTNVGPGGPSSTGGPGGMVAQSNFDVPRVPGPLTAIIGDPRNDENLIVVQFHHAMMRFHNAVVDLLLAAAFAGDIFAEAKRIVTHHYQWAVVHDFLKRICGVATVNNALASVVAPPGSAFRMPVEFAVAAYRFGHSMIRDTYWVNFNFPAATLGQVFEFNRVPRLPVFSNWVVDFNAFFDTGVPVPVHNKARRIDSFMAAGLESLPGLDGDDGDSGDAEPEKRSGARLAERPGHGEFLRHRADDGRAVDVGTSRQRGRSPELERWHSAQQDPALVLRPSGGSGPGWREPVGTGRRQDRGGHVRPHAEARRLVVPERLRRIRADSAVRRGRRFYGGRPRDVRGRDAALRSLRQRPGVSN